MRALLRLLSSLLLFVLITNSTLGQYIYLRMSVKIIVDPVTGERPDGITPLLFTNAVAAANGTNASYWRGYRYKLTEVADIGGPAQGGTNGPSYWFGRDFRSPPVVFDFMADATNDTRYLLRTDQVNVWVATKFADNAGGAMPIPPQDLNRIGGQIFADEGPWWILHELGHFFGLEHTFNGEDQSTCTPGDDGLADTLPDSNCWTNRDMVAQYYFLTDYAALPASEAEQVDNLFFNVMSYHGGGTTNKNTTQNRMTELQLDRHADHASGDRNAFASGRTWFVDRASTFPSPDGRSTNYSSLGGVPVGGPYPTLSNGVASANSAGGDLVLLRPGSYNEQMTINQPVTLRASRAGQATIGKP